MVALSAQILFYLLCIVDIMLCLCRKWKTTIVLLIILYIHNYIWQILPIHYFYNTTDSYDCRVLTYNIFPDGHTDIEKWQKDIFKEIKNISADVICLQEYDYTRYPQLSDSLNAYYKYIQLVDDSQCESLWRIYSRFPMYNPRLYSMKTKVDTVGMSFEKKKEIDWLQKRLPICSFDVQLPTGGIITFFSCHLRSNGYSTARRAMKQSDNWIKGIPRYIESLQYGESIRLIECKELRAVIDSVGNNTPIVVVGDFNDVNKSSSISLIQGETLKDA